jgi:hypothetical protein
MTDGVGEQPGRGLQALVVSGLLGQVGEEVAEPMPREAPPAALGVEPEQDLGHGQADQLGIGEARRPAGTAADAEQDEEVVDGDVPCRDEGVELGLHIPLLGTLARLVTACFPSIANSESFI